MALPLKTGADLYNQQLIRARLQNLGAQPNTADVGLGQVYFNTGTNTAASLRIGYCYETGSVPKFHHVANLEDVNRLEELISALSGSSSESVASVLGRVITLEGYFSNGKAKDADLLDGHNSDYFATATTVNDLLEDYEAFKAVFEDNSDDYINTWTEVKNFLDGIKNTEDLNAILLGINTELGNKANKATTLAGYGITDGMRVMPWIGSEGVDFNNLTTVGSYGIASVNAHNGPLWYGTLLTMGGDYNYYRSQLAVYEEGQMYVRAKNGNDIWSDWRTILDNKNYSDLITDLNNSLNVKGSISANSVQISRSTLVGQLLGGNEDYTYVGRTKSGVWEKDIFKFYANDDNYAYGNFIFEKQINSANGIKIGNAILSWDEDAQALKINTNVYSDGQVSSGGIGSEGSGSGASGIVILEDWEKYDDTLAQVLGAGLGVGLRDRVAALESKATKVSVSGLLESGKSIGTIKVDDTSYNLLAPDDYLPLSGGVIKGSLEKRLPTEGATQNYILFTRHNGTAQGYLGFNGVDNPIYIPSAANAIYALLHEGNYKSFLDYAYLRVDGANVLKAPLVSTSSYLTLNGCSLYAKNGDTADWRVTTKDWTSEFRLLHSDNYESIVGNKFLKLGGGTLTDSVMVNHSSGSKGYLLLTNGASIGGLVTNGTAVELFNVNGYGVGVEGTSDVYVLTNWAKKTMLHEGNFNSYAPTLTGVGASGTWGIDISGSAAKAKILEYSATIEDSDALDGFLGGNAAKFAIFKNITSLGFQGNDGIVMALPWTNAQDGVQVAFDERHVAPKMFMRAKSANTWGEWKKFAFTDSDITGNAAGLKHSNGTQALIVDANGYLEATQSIRNAGDSWYLGSISKALGKTDLKGGMLYSYSDPLYFGNKAEIRMLINSSGNVTIGERDLASTNYKLYVNGTIRAAKSITSYAKDGYSQVELLYGDNTGWVLSQRGAETSKDFGVYSLVNGVDTCRFRIKEDGNVGIGTNSPKAKLHVNGTILAKENVMTLGTHGGYSLYGGIRDGEAFSLETTNSEAAWQAWVMRVTLSGAVSFNHNVSVRTRLLVGAATDDGITALQVHGDIVIPNYTAYKAYDTNGGKMNLMYLDTSNRLKVYNDTMSFTPQGKVGIGTPTPQETLHVVGNLYVTGNIIADGQVSSGGVAEAGTGGAGGGSALDRVPFTIPVNTTSFTCEHNLGTREISVSIYEEGNDFQQVLTDVYLDSDNTARIVFGAATDVVHKVVIIG